MGGGFKTLMYVRRQRKRGETDDERGQRNKGSFKPEVRDEMRRFKEHKAEREKNIFQLFSALMAGCVKNLGVYLIMFVL